MPGTKAIDGRYEVRELRDVIASDTPGESGGFRTREDYPVGLQPRNYTGNRIEMEKVRKFAMEMDTAQYLTDDPNATGGPPTITPDGIVLNGNGRQMSLEEAVRTGTYAKYKSELAAKAERFGIDPKKIEGMKEPVLYRVVNMDATSELAREFARRGNETTTQKQTPERRAASLGGVIDDAILDSLKITGEETFAQAVNTDKGAKFRTKLREKLPSEVTAEFFNPDDTLTDAGKVFVGDMLATKVVPIEVLERIKGINKNLANAIESAAPQLIALNRNTKVNPVPALNEALEFLSKNPEIADMSGVSNALDQRDIFGQTQSISPAGRMMVDFVMQTAGQGRTKVFREKLVEMAGDLSKVGKSNLFGDVGPKLNETEKIAEVLGVKPRNGAKFLPLEKPARDPEGFGRTMTPEEKSAGIEDEAAKMLADVQANRTVDQGPGTAMKANFGSEKEAKEAGRTFVQAAKDFYRQLGGATAPQIDRSSPESANKVAQFVNARAYTDELAPVMIDKILPSDPTKGHLDLTAGAVLTEMRLRHMRKAYLEKAVTEQDPVLKKEYHEAAKKVKSIVGQPIDGDVLANPLGTEADFQRYLSDPEVMVVLDKWKEHMVPFMDQQFRDAEGLDPAEAIPTFTQMPGLPMNLMRWKPGSKGEGVIHIGPDPSTSIGGIGRQKLQKLGFAQRATGAAEGYHVRLSDLVHHSILGSYETAAKARMIRTMVDEGVAKFGRPGFANSPEGFPAELRDVKPPKGTQSAGPEQTSLWFKDKGQANEVYQALDLGRKFNQLPMAGFFNLMTLRSLGELTAHTSNLLTGMLKPGMRFRDLMSNAVGVVRKDKAIQERITELARIGAIKPKGLETNMDNPTVWAKLDPLQFTGKFLDIVDRSIRLTAEQAFKRTTAKIKGLDSSEGAMRDFINQLGNYNHRTQNRAIQLARQTGVGPFATAGSTFYINGLKSLWGGHGYRTGDAKADLRLRAAMMGRLVTALAVVPVANYLQTGRVDGDDNTPVGAIYLGKTEDGKTRYFDLASLTGVTRGAREVGLQALIEGVRPGARKAGSSTGSVIDKGMDDALKSLIHPFTGPLVGAAYTTATGKDLIGRQLAAVPSTATTAEGIAKAKAMGKPAPGESQVKYNAIAALIHANPVLAALIELGGFDPAHKKTTGEREVMKQLGRYGIKESQSPPGTPRRKIEIPVKSKK